MVRLKEYDRETSTKKMPWPTRAVAPWKKINEIK
jgi:hypothetical protein